MASEDCAQPEIEPSVQDLRSHERVQPEWLDSDFSDLHMPDGAFLDQYLVPASWLLPENHSGFEPIVEPGSGSFDDIGDKLLGQPATEPFDQGVTSSSSDSVHVEDTLENWALTLMGMIRQMMFVSGETSEASVETTTIIEEIVHTQVTEIVSLAASL